MYAHAKIENSETGEVFERGDIVPDDLPGIEDLVEFGSVSKEPFNDPDPYRKQPTMDTDLLRIQRARDEYVNGDISAAEFEKRITEPIEHISANDAGSTADGAR